MQGFIKIPNSVFEHNLTASEMLTYCFLLLKSNRFHTTTLKLTTIANGLGCSRSTAANAIYGLEHKGLLTIQSQYKKGFQTANKYYVAQLPGKWFKLDRSIFNLNLNKSDFMVYLYILRCSNKSGNAFPSAARISSMTGISEPRVRLAVKELASLCLIRKQRQKRLCGCYGCNHFFIYTRELRQRILSLYRKIKRQPLIFLRAAVFSFVQVLAGVCSLVFEQLPALFCGWLGKQFYLRI